MVRTQCPVALTMCWEALGCTLALLLHYIPGIYPVVTPVAGGVFYAGRDESNALHAGRAGRHLLVGLGCTLGPADWVGRVLLLKLPCQRSTCDR